MDFMKDVVALAVGGVHIFAKKHDMKETVAPAPLKGYTGYAAIAGVGLGLVGSIWMPKYEKYAEALRLASEPLLLVELYNAVVNEADRISASPRMVSRPMGRSVRTQPGFDGVRLV